MDKMTMALDEFDRRAQEIITLRQELADAKEKANILGTKVLELQSLIEETQEEVSRGKDPLKALSDLDWAMREVVKS